MGHAAARACRARRRQDRRVPRVDARHADAGAARDRRSRARCRARLSGIPEPLPDCPEVARDAIDGCWCRASPSIAQGGGWAMAAATTTGCCRCSRRVPRASPARSSCRSSRVPAAPHDVAVDAIVTETRDVDAAMSVQRRRRGSTRARPPARTAAVALAITLAIQMFTSLAATATSVLAPEIARDLGISPKLVGVFVGLVYVGAMAGEPRLGRLHRALRRDPRVAGLRAVLRGGLVAGGVGARLCPACASRARRSRRSSSASATGRSRRVVAYARAHRAAGADGADVLDQADRRAGRRRAGRRGAAR